MSPQESQRFEQSPATRCRQQSQGFAPPPPLRPGRVVVVVLEDVVEFALCLLAGVSGRPKKRPTKVGGGALGFKGGTENQGAVCYPATIRCAAAAALVLRAWAALSLGPGKRSGPAMVADRTRTAGGSCAASSASFLPRIMPGCPVKLECAAKGNKRVLEVGRQKKTPCSSHSVSDYTPLYLRGTKMQVGGGGRGRKNSRSRRPEETSTGVAYLGFV